MHKGHGAEHEYERPITYPLDDGSDDEIAWLNDGAWSDIVSARQTTLFDRPVAHFFIRAFQSDRIDEFLAHISTIKAALGLPLDHDQRGRRRIAGKNPGVPCEASNFRTAQRWFVRERLFQAVRASE